jgi:hypothetical protein
MITVGVTVAGSGSVGIGVRAAVLDAVIVADGVRVAVFVGVRVGLLVDVEVRVGLVVNVRVNPVVTEAVSAILIL